MNLCSIGMANGLYAHSYMVRIRYFCGEQDIINNHHIKMSKHILFLISLFTLCTAQAQEDIKVGSTTRNMIVYAPKDLPENAALVISLHGANQDAAYQRNQTNWNNCADTAKIVVVYPNAINKFWDTGCARGTGDLLFIETIINEMYKRYGINRNRVYVSGFSLGAMMTYHCMEHLSDMIAACAPVSGVRFDNKAPNASRQVPLIHTHGTGDDVFKWEGDPGHMAGGYPYIPDYVQKWATYYKCTEKTVISPYPSSKKNSNATLTRWKQPGSEMEVALLQLEGKGHWHSEDLAGGVSTTQEIWKFMKRYSLGPEPPKVLSIEPENNSFDLPLEQRSFAINLDGEADREKVNAVLATATGDIKLTMGEDNGDNTLTFNVPDGVTLPEGECTLHVTGICAPGGGMGVSANATYIYGVTPVSDVLKIDTLLAPNWPAMASEMGQCIPLGWKINYYDSNGSSTTVASGTTGLTSGCRLFALPEGGDFTAGFYLSARDNAKTLLSYGRYSAYRLNMPVGRYDLSLRSTYWSTGSKDANATFDISVHPLANEDYILQETVQPTGCQAENLQQKAKGTAAHLFTINVTKAGNYSLDFSMTQGWNSVLLADVTITSQLSIPEQYKGTLHRLLLEAAAICDGNDNTAVEALREALDTYRDFASTSPTEYTAAIDAMRKAFDTLPVGVAPTASVPTPTTYYTLDGRRLNAAVRGLNIERSSKGTRKIIKM